VLFSDFAEGAWQKNVSHLFLILEIFAMADIDQTLHGDVM